MSDHIRQLEEIDREQRAKEQQATPDSPFAQTIVEALDPEAGKQSTPLLAQEEIELEEPPRINLTAVVCTTIVAVCATIILLVAHPWRTEDDDTLQADLIEQPTSAKPQNEAAEPQAKETTPAAAETPKPAETQPATEPKAAEAKDEPKTEPKKYEPAATLPVVATTKTGTENPYNNLRLIDASSRLLTKAEVAQMSAPELALARNAIYARHGYQFNNAELKEYFSKQSWFKASDVKIDAIPFSQIELDNIRLIKAQEQNQ